MNIFCASGRYYNTEHTQANHQVEADDLANLYFKKRKEIEKNKTHILER